MTFSPQTAFSLLAIVEAIGIIVLIVGLEPQCKSHFLKELFIKIMIFFLLSILFIGIRQGLGLKYDLFIIAVAVLWEESQKFFVSLKSRYNPISVSAIFAAVELFVVKANLILPTDGYLDGIYQSNLGNEILSLQPAVFLHLITGLIYWCLLRRFPSVAFFICVSIHFAFNILVINLI